jgi:histidinol-phosphate aminotransferase
LKFFPNIRLAIENLTPYQWELSTEDIASLTQLPPKEIRRMDTNTSPFLPAKSIQKLRLKLESLDINEYPDTSYATLRKSLSNYCKFASDHFVVTNGADEALDIISKVMLNPNDEAIIPTPSYSMFRVVTEISGARVVNVPRKNFDLDLEGIRKRINERTKILFLCSPNNPTGDSIPIEDLRGLLDLCRDRVMVVVDEAYFEYSGHSFARLTRKHDNLVIVRTFSKAFAMAGVRVGYTISSTSTAKILNKVRPPNSLTNISLALAQSALEDMGSMKRNVATIITEKERFAKQLAQAKGVKVFPSDANFVLVKLRSADISERIHGSLMKRGFVIRDFSQVPGIEGCLRITVNKPRVNKEFLDVFIDLVRKEN